MKKTMVLLMVAFSACLVAVTPVWAANTFGLNLGAAIPTGTMADYLENGFSFGAMANIDTPSPVVDISFGLSHATINSEWSDSWDLTSLFIGPRFGKGEGVYFFPAAALNMADGDSRFGLDFGLGYLIPMGEGKTRVDLGIKYSALNLAGKDEGEDSLGMVTLFVGIYF